MYFQLPTSDFLAKAFRGAEEYFAATPTATAPSGDLSRAGVTCDRAGATCDGFTLLTTNQNAEALLLDMAGRVVHRWTMPAAQPWEAAPHVRAVAPGEPIHWEKCRLYANGDLLALCCCGGGLPYGYALAKLDKDSRLLWAFSANVHHDMDVGDDGRIYLLTYQHGVPAPPDFPTGPGRYTADYLVVLSREGRELSTIPILECFRGGSYFPTLLGAAAEVIPKDQLPQVAQPQPGSGGGRFDSADALHANSVQVLNAAQASKFPLFRAGQVLISLRTPNVLAVLDPAKRSVAWAAKGVWQAQHDTRFLDNGNLLVFDNKGLPWGARVLEYNPSTQVLAWSYPHDRTGAFPCKFRGGSQRLINGNTLIVDSEGLRVLEVTAAEEVVWQWSCPRPEASAFTGVPREMLNITGATRYRPSELTFVKPGTPLRGS
jgi:hypothetical protein